MHFANSYCSFTSDSGRFGNHKKFLNLWNSWLLILLLAITLDRSFINSTISIDVLNIQLTIEFYH